MAYPVVVDCGGSTRLKRFDSRFGAMNGLLDVDPTTNPPASSETINRSYSNWSIAYIDEAGTAHQVAAAQPVRGGDTLTITSENNQAVVMTINASNTSLTIQVLGIAGNPPLVEAKHINQKRRYVVINAGAIQTVVGTVNGRAFTFDFTAVAPPSIYASVILN